ncbi:MAG: hypothetical protein H0T18_05310 [Chloroflexia bacterium]|nr:hypothetical protein [Chloroflexia bacterium]
MTKAPHTIHLDPDSELARTLAEANDRPVVLESNGIQFHVLRSHEDPWVEYDPEKVRAGLRKFAGMITQEEAERIKESIYRGRVPWTRPLDRP